MQELLKRVSAWMASHSSTYVIAAAVMAFLLPDTFSWVRGDVSSVILGVIMNYREFSFHSIADSLFIVVILH